LDDCYSRQPLGSRVRRRKPWKSSTKWISRVFRCAPCFSANLL